MPEEASDVTLVVGKITGCYGIKGWVRVHAYTEPPENFLQLGQWQIKRRGVLEPVCFDRGKRHGKGLVAHIEGVDDRTLAESFNGLEILAPESVIPALEEGEFYWRDLVGLSVWCLQGSERVLLGKVDYLIETGANDVLVVKACAGSVDNRERLIPYLLDQTVLRVDTDEALIEVDWFVDE
ncbi:MAG: ribosome maturation factor RimM [Halioglobus sp.]